MSLSAVAPPVDVLNPVRPPNAAAARTPAAIRKVAEDFEASFLSSMLQPIFNQLSTDGMFGGGQGEAAFKSFMVDSMARQMARHGGVGLSDDIARQMLRLQGMADAPDPAAPQTPQTPANATTPAPVEDAA
jgi:Rod binding domain-containing protein